MNQFLQQDIFFFVTTVAVVLVAVMFSIALVYVIKIVRDVRHITGKVREETDIISMELGELRKNIRKEGVKIKHFTKFFAGVKKKSVNN